MVLGLIEELLWSVPLIALTILASKSLHATRPTKRRHLTIILGTALGIAYAVAISFVAGPIVTAVSAPFLPLMMTIGATAGLLGEPREWRSTTSRSICLCLLIVLIAWLGFFPARKYVSRKDEFRLVVIAEDGPPGPVRWDDDLSSSQLAPEERSRIERLIGSASGTLRPVLAFQKGESPKTKAILVMVQDVSRRVQLPMPEAETAIFVQDRNGKWRHEPSNFQFAGRSLTLEPASNGQSTRIEVPGLFGTTSSEVEISHKK